MGQEFAPPGYRFKCRACLTLSPAKTLDRDGCAVLSACECPAHHGQLVEHSDYDPFERVPFEPITAQDAEYLRGEPVPLKITIPVVIEEDRSQFNGLYPRSTAFGCYECSEDMCQAGRVPGVDCGCGCHQSR